MAVTTRNFGRRRNQGYVQVVDMDATDVVIIDFDGRPSEFSQDGQFPSIRWPADWLGQIETGAVITVDFAVNPDYENSVTGDWVSHATHSTFDEDTGFQEQMAMSALRFTAATAGVKITVSTPFPVKVVVPA